MLLMGVLELLYTHLQFVKFIRKFLFEIYFQISFVKILYIIYIIFSRNVYENGRILFCTLFALFSLLHKKLLLLQQQAEDEEGTRSFQFYDCAKHRYSIKLLLKVVLNFQTDSEEQALLTRR